MLWFKKQNHMVIIRFTMFWDKQQSGRYLFCVIIQYPDGKGYPVSPQPGASLPIPLAGQCASTAQPDAHPCRIGPATTIRPADLPDWLSEQARPVPTLEQRTRKALEEVLSLAPHNKAEAARLLGITRKTLYALLRKHGINSAYLPL